MNFHTLVKVAKEAVDGSEEVRGHTGGMTWSMSRWKGT